MRQFFDQVLDLPKRSVDSSVGPVAAALVSITSPNQTQQESNYSSSSLSQKQAESIVKLQQGGMSGSFDNVSKNISLVQSNTSATVTDKTSRIPLVEIPLRQKNSDLPANFYLPPNNDKTKELKVKLVSQPLNETVVFEVMPSISESRNAAYDEFTPLQHPGDMLKYRATASRSWSLSTKLVSRSSEEATKNLKTINIIRAWTMPFYGVGTENDPSTKQYLGSPPQILTLTAYGKMMIGPVKCVLESYNWQFPDNVDYLPAYPDGGESGPPSPFPVILNIELQLKESYSPAEFSGFSLSKFKNGELPAAFTAISASQQRANGTQTSVPLPRGISNEPANNRMRYRTFSGDPFRTINE